MLHGELSNRGAPVIGFRVDGFIITPKSNPNLLQRAGQKLFDPYIAYDINEPALQLVHDIFLHTDYSACFIAGDGMTPLCTRAFDKLRQNLPYGDSVRNLPEPIDVALQLRGGMLDYYVDDNLNHLTSVGVVNACLPLSHAYVLLSSKERRNG